MNRRLGVLLLALLLVACGQAAAGPGDPARGQQLFSGALPIAAGKAPPCANCHVVNVGEQASIGRNLSNIGTRAATTVPDQSAVEYLRTSIIDPDAYLVGGFQEGIMYREYRPALTEQQLNDMVAYLPTLQSGRDE